MEELELGFETKFVDIVFTSGSYIKLKIWRFGYLILYWKRVT